MATVAYLTGASWRGGALDPNGLPGPETPTFEAIARAGAAEGLRFVVRRWDDPELLTHPPEAALIRSCWDYPERADAFLARLDALEAAGVRVVNPARLVRWNLRKRYLGDLAADGAPTIPTMFVERCDARAAILAFDTFDAAEIVIKPEVGAGSRNTIRLSRNSWSDMDLAQAPAGPAMLQPFLPAITSEGERSLFFFGGRYAYAILKRPAPGSWLANVADVRFSALEPSPADREAAERVMAAAPAGLVYARVDLVTGGVGAPALIELEAI
jgi:glutathione synthase/RimK-type ligase-like ATP-grasp enzyme